jgi:hypothetical protein
MKGERARSSSFLRVAGTSNAAFRIRPSLSSGEVHLSRQVMTGNTRRPAFLAFTFERYSALGAEWWQ